MNGIRIEQLDAMRMGVEYKHPCKVRSFTVYLRPLTISETMEAATTTNELLEGMPEIARTRIAEHTILAKETLKRAALEDPDRDISESKLSDMILNKMTNDEVHLLYKQYISVCDKVNPSLEILPQEEINKLVEQAKKNTTQLIDLSFLELLSLAQYLLNKDG